MTAQAQTSIARRPDVGYAAPLPVPSNDMRQVAGCKVQLASYGGSKAVLIRAIVAGEQQLTALQVLDGFETSMTESFTRTYAPGGSNIGEFVSQQAAVEQAYQLCAAGTAGPPRR